MKRIIAVILALVMCVAGAVFGGNCASAFVIGGCFPPAYTLTTVPGYVPTLSYDVYGSVVGSVVGWVGSGDALVKSIEVAKELMKSPAVYRPVSRDVHNVKGRYTVIWDCFRGPTIIEEPPERPKGLWDLIFAVIGEPPIVHKGLWDLIFAIIIHWIW